MITRFVLAVCLLAPAAAFAQNAATPGALELYPTLNAVGVRVPIASG